MDIIAGILILIGKYFVGKKSRIGFIFQIVGNLFLTVIALRAGIYGLLIISIPAFVLDGINLWRWTKNDK